MDRSLWKNYKTNSDQHHVSPIERKEFNEEECSCLAKAKKAPKHTAKSGKQKAKKREKNASSISRECGEKEEKPAPDFEFFAKYFL